MKKQGIALFVFFLLNTMINNAIAASLQSLIDQAKPGDTLQIPAGNYYGDVVIDKTIHLIGTERPLLIGTTKGSVITVLADGCTIRGFNIQQSGKDLQNEDSGILLKSNDNRIEDNQLQDVLFGIYLYHSSGNSVTHNSIQGRASLEQGDRGNGIHLWSSPHNQIDGNQVWDVRDGLFIQNSEGNRIINNRIFDLRYGVHYMFSDSNTFERNTFTNNVAGAAIMYSRNIRFKQNLFLHNRGYSSFGILFQECDECLAEENWIIDNVTGLFAEALRNSTIRKNVIAENDVALQMFGSANNNLISGNHFVDNLSPIQVIGIRTNTRWEENGTGNFWSDYDGYDLDGDGIGDVSNRIQNVFEYMESNHPRLRLYLYSPAATAIAAAEKAFPIVEGSNEIDPHPLMHPGTFQLPEELAPRSQPFSAQLGFFSIGITVVSGLIFWRNQR